MQQQAVVLGTSVLATSETPSWNALKLRSIPAARNRLAGYRIGEDQSAGMKAILRPPAFGRAKAANSCVPIQDFEAGNGLK
jgi:hypothetical protein